MTDPELAFEIIIEVLTLFVLIVGLVGLLMPIFPGLTIMWLAILFYAVVQSANGRMMWYHWVLFGIITLLMIGGNIVDNIIIAKHVREKQVPWSSILFAFAVGIVTSIFLTPLVGILASPVGLFVAELRRLRERNAALANTKAWMKGWGWSIAARMGIGVVMIFFWGIWAWV